MKKRGSARFTTAFTTAILLVLLVGGITYYTLQNQVEEAVQIEHTYKVLNQVSYLEGLLVDMETGRRGFRCTNDTQFLQPYYKSQPKLAGAIDGIKSLVATNADQSERAATLEKDVYKLDNFWKAININTIYSDSVQKRYVTQQEKIIMDKVREDVDAITKATDKTLEQRGRDNNTAISVAIWTLVAGIVLILLVVFALISLTLSESKRRIKAQDILKEKLAEVEKNNIETQERNWLLTGIREINECLIASDTLKDIIDSCLAKIVDYMGVPAGAFYFYDAEKRHLLLAGAVALPLGIQEKINLNEGITGHAATQKEITVTHNIPEDYWQIESAAGAALPDTILCLPLWQNGQLKGVIELACFRKGTKEIIELLQAVADNIAIAINGAHSNERMSALLGKVQEQKEELESQQEELRQTNEELTNQAETLRASEEELKTQEEELRQINVEMKEKTEAVVLAGKALEQKAEQLEESNRYKSEFLANMSHELRTPLNSVLILANLLKTNKDNNLTQKQVEYAQIIHRSGSDLLSLINDILDLSKIEAGKIDMIFEPVKLKDVASNMDQLFTALANEKKINYIVSLPFNGPEIITTDRQRIEQVIKNLLSNAFKFTPAEGSIELAFRREEGHLSISVTDTGIGISPEQQQLIFEAFQQADGSTSRKYGGTGLGLSISKELVKRLHGEIRVSSATGKGSVFTVLLPLAHTGGAIPTPSEIAPAQRAMEVNLKNVKEQTLIEDSKAVIKPGEMSILIIEDDTVFAGLVNDFAHEKGYKTIIAISGDEGIYYARKYKPSAIILDLGLPVIDGRNVLKILKSEDGLKDIPVHVVTAEDKFSFTETEVEGFFQKPLKMNDLEQAFSSIGSYIKEHYKNILVLSAGEGPLWNMFDSLAAEKSKGITYVTTKTADEAKVEMGRKVFDCMIADIGSEIKKGIATLKELKEAGNGKMYIITCLDGDITTADEKKLKKYSDSIIRKTSFAPSRLMDEVELFLHKIKDTKSVVVPGHINKEFEKSLKGRKVLLADDDMRNVFAITAMLEEQGMNVVAAEHGKEALELLDKNKDVDIVLMDIMMPEMDGYEAIRHIRAKKGYGKLPIIALTAKAMSGDREKCVEAGASDYITKPIDSNKLTSLMRVWLS